MYQDHKIKHLMKALKMKNISHSLSKEIHIILGTMCLDDEKSENLIRNHNLLNLYSLVLLYDDEKVSDVERTEICFNLSNIIAGPMTQKLYVLESGLFRTLISMLIVSESNKVRNEIVFALSNAVEDSNERIIKELMDHDIMNAVCFYLESDTRNVFDIEMNVLSKFIKYKGYVIVYNLRDKLEEECNEKCESIWKQCSLYAYAKLADKHKKLGKCRNCRQRKKEIKLYLCTKCLNAKYCSKHCQKIHWKRHRRKCDLFEL